MIEIVHQYKKDWSMFTLASLLGKADNFARIHLYVQEQDWDCLLYTSPSPRDNSGSRMPSSA